MAPIAADRQEQIPDVRFVILHACNAGSLLFSGLSPQTVCTVITPIHFEENVHSIRKNEVRGTE